MYTRCLHAASCILIRGERGGLNKLGPYRFGRSGGGGGGGAGSCLLIRGERGGLNKWGGEGGGRGGGGGGGGGAAAFAEGKEMILNFW